MSKVEKKADAELAPAELEANKKAAKEFVNQIRVLCGERKAGVLKKGYQHPALNPIVSALEVCGVREAWAHEDEVYIQEHPKLGTRVLYYKRPGAAQFLRDYEAGKYPELVIPAKPLKIKFGNERKARVVG